MNLENRLSKLEASLSCNQPIGAITGNDSDKALLSTGEMVSKTDLSKYPNLVLFDFDPNRPREQGRTLKQLTGNPRDVTATTVARLIMAYGGSLADVAEAI